AGEMDDSLGAGERVHDLPEVLDVADHVAQTLGIGFARPVEHHDVMPGADQPGDHGLAELAPAAGDDDFHAPRLTPSGYPAGIGLSGAAAPGEISNCFSVDGSPASVGARRAFLWHQCRHPTMEISGRNNCSGGQLIFDTMKPSSRRFNR